MKFSDYVKEEAVRGKPMNETMAQAGETDVFKGSQYCGSHHHTYILWSTQTRNGITGPAIEDAKDKNVCVAGHEHLIVDGKVLECNGHTHELLKAEITKPDVDLGSSNIAVYPFGIGK